METIKDSDVKHIGVAEPSEEKLLADELEERKEQLENNVKVVKLNKENLENLEREHDLKKGMHQLNIEGSTIQRKFTSDKLMEESEEYKKYRMLVADHNRKQAEFDLELEKKAYELNKVRKDIEAQNKRLLDAETPQSIPWIEKRIPEVEEALKKLSK